jgi:hypothetical protein
MNVFDDLVNDDDLSTINSTWHLSTVLEGWYDEASVTVCC